LLFGDLSRPDAGGRGRRGGVRPLHGSAAVRGSRGRAAGLGLVVRGKTPTPDDGGRTTEGEDRKALRRGPHNFGQLEGRLLESDRIADIRAVRVVPGNRQSIHWAGW